MVSCWSSRRGLGTGNLGCPESTFPTFSTFSTLRTFRCHLGQWWLRLKMGYVAQKWVRPSIDEVSCPLQVDLFWDKRTLAVAFFMFFFEQNEKTPPWLGFFLQRSGARVTCFVKLASRHARAWEIGSDEDVMFWSSVKVTKSEVTVWFYNFCLTITICLSNVTFGSSFQSIWRFSFARLSLCDDICSPCLARRTSTLPSWLSRRSAMMRWPTTWRPWVTMATSFPLRNATCCPWPTRTPWDLVVLLGASFLVWSRRRSPRAMMGRLAMPKTTVSRSRTNCRRFVTRSSLSWTQASSQRQLRQSPKFSTRRWRLITIVTLLSSAVVRRRPKQQRRLERPMPKRPRWPRMISPWLIQFASVWLWIIPSSCMKCSMTQMKLARWHARPLRIGRVERMERGNETLEMPNKQRTEDEHVIIIHCAIVHFANHIKL